MVARIILLVCLAMILVLFASCGSKEDTTREAILEKLTSQDIRAVLTEQDIANFLENLDSSEIINKETLLKHLTKEDILRLLDNEDFIAVFSDGEYDDDVFLLQRHPMKKCATAHVVYVTSVVKGTNYDYYNEFSGLGTIFGDYIISTVTAVPDLDFLEDQLTKIANSPFPPGFVPPPEEEMTEEMKEALERARRERQIDRVELSMFTVVTVDKHETYRDIELPDEVFRDENMNIVLLKRHESDAQREYFLSSECEIIIADVPALSFDSYENYGLAIPGYNSGFYDSDFIPSLETGSLIYFNADENEFRVIGSILPEEIGGPIYVLMDGEPHLAGILNRTAAFPYGYETEATAVDMHYLIDLFKANGFDIFSPMPENTKDE